MSKECYIGVDGIARKVTTCYIGVDDVARKITTCYIGVDDVARMFFSGAKIYTLSWGDIVSRTSSQLTNRTCLASTNYVFDENAGTIELASPTTYFSEKTALDNALNSGYRYFLQNNAVIRFEYVMTPYYYFSPAVIS